MEQNGYDIMVAQTGEEALEIIMRSPSGMILLDIMLLGIEGMGLHGFRY
jgi:DNA-binding response OmpR family regulator